MPETQGDIAQNIQQYIQLIDETSADPETPSESQNGSNRSSNHTSSSTSSWSLVADDSVDKASSVWPTVCSVCINVFVPFINGMMLGFGEIAAHEVGFYFGWGGSKVAEQSKRETEKRRQAYLHEREGHGRVVWDNSSNSIRDANAGGSIASTSKWF